MGLGKSLGIGLIIYIVLNFLMNMLLVIAATVPDLTTWFSSITSAPFGFLSNLFVISSYIPMGTAILTGISLGITTLGSNVFLGIMLLVGYIIPPLITAVIAGKMADNSKQGFLSWLLISLLCAIVVMVFHIVAPLEMVGIVIFGVGELWSEIVFTLLIGLFNGLLWGGIAAITAAED
jgi:hypothetical protein